VGSRPRFVKNSIILIIAFFILLYANCVSDSILTQLVVNITLISDSVVYSICLFKNNKP
jgi:hypothetical protein